MKVKYQISQPLKFPVQTKIFLISYQDEAIYRQINQTLRTHYQLPHQTKMTLETIDDWQKLALVTQHYSLFNEAQIYEIEILTSALKTKKFPPLVPLDSDIFIFKTQDFKAPLLEQLHALPHSLWIQAYAASSNELWRYLKAKLTQLNLSAEIETWFMQQQLDFNLCQELVEKIHLGFKSEDTLTLKDFQNLLGFTHPELNWSPLIDAWMQASKRETLKLIRRLQFKESDLILLVWLLARQTQVLYALKQGIQEPKIIFNDHKLWPKQQEQCQLALRHFSLHFLEQALVALHHIDKLLKSGQGSLALAKLEQFFLMES